MVLSWDSYSYRSVALTERILRVKERDSSRLHGFVSISVWIVYFFLNIVFILLFLSNRFYGFYISSSHHHFDDIDALFLLLPLRSENWSEKLPVISCWITCSHVPCLIFPVWRQAPNQKRISLSSFFFFENLSTVMTSRRRILPSPASPVSSPSLTLILHNDNLCISNEDDIWPEPVSSGELWIVVSPTFTSILVFNPLHGISLQLQYVPRHWPPCSDQKPLMSFNRLSYSYVG